MSIGAIGSNLRVFIGAPPPARDAAPASRQTLHDNEASPAERRTNLPAVSSPFEAAQAMGAEREAPESNALLQDLA